MGNFNLADYEPVEDRLARFWADHPAGRVATLLVASEGTEWVFRAEVYRDADDAAPWATGYAHEVTGQGMVNKTSACENCETSAIGRALANAGYAPKGKRPSREEMTKASAPASRSTDRRSAAKTGTGTEPGEGDAKNTVPSPGAGVSIGDVHDGCGGMFTQARVPSRAVCDTCGHTVKKAAA